MREVVVGIVVVLFIGFAGMFVATSTVLIDTWNHRTDSYTELQDQVMSQNAKIDALTVQLERAQDLTPRK